jgi:hypothetical protein
MTYEKSTHISGEEGVVLSVLYVGTAQQRVFVYHLKQPLKGIFLIFLVALIRLMVNV